MKVYRITQKQYADDLSGNGARLYGGRWNSKGNAVLYTSESSSLAMLEILAHADARYIKSEFKLITIELSNALKIGEIDSYKLKNNWRDYPPPSSLQFLGDEWLEKREFEILKVPSVVNPFEKNFLINPLLLSSQDIKIINLQNLSLDGRFYTNKW